ncbi:RNA polymerase III transcription factor IIIC subunit-domain-containing protein [Limtongia smithiae]|uniref:RNA polymerase III transcription factor IIIC subunit-domain-containing protein n=1 Tax=Limtongia smithiae TaxID=1125753 RepID=UPI0034CEDBF3
MSLDIVPRVFCVEHPARVRDPDMALRTLGGPDALRRHISSAGDTPLELRLRPRDRFAHPIMSRSANASAHSVLLEVRVSKALLAEHGGDLHKALAAAPDSYSVAPYAVINHHVRFRELADFQYSTLNSPFATKIRNSLFSGDLNAITALSFDDMPQAPDLDMPPPPRFSRITVPFDYAYRQNPAVTVVTDSAGVTHLVNRTVAKRLFSKVVRWTDTAVPDASFPSKNLPVPKNTPSNPRLLEIIELLQAKFDEKPIWTRRSLEAEALPADLQHMWASHVKFALPYVAFTWKSGPWRATYTKYGVDPRTDPQYAKYQTEYFRFTPGESGDKRPAAPSNINAAPGGHIFDGIHLTNARAFQLCYITDPVLADLVEHGAMREKPDEKDGWYKAAVISKLRRILRLKLTALSHGQTVKQMDIATILEEPSDEEMPAADDDDASKQEEQAMTSTAAASAEKEVLEAVSAVSADGGDRLKELLGILQQEEGNGEHFFVKDQLDYYSNDLTDANAGDEYDIYDDAEDGEEDEAEGEMDE